MKTATTMPAHAKRVATARRLGEEAGQASLALAEQDDPDFGAKAYQFIVAYVRKRRRVPGESVTLACCLAGIRPKDDRSFGPIYAKAIRAGDIRVVGTVARVRGHGSAGGKLYAPGKARTTQ
ncbi:hypothetical protein [Variovorax sp. PMC12]|uniref:hypothetical protein n=1 Tax=Variovorax sp. PMC12 TaxID=2126319 RepID=UPI000D127318|nr:hypothetical protein [Variovorax sp. PMC12]AVQ84270.1 hypothetical protein C4F17_26810 [Variovorax sp. PMC12]